MTRPTMKAAAIASIGLMTALVPAARAQEQPPEPTETILPADGDDELEQLKARVKALEDLIEALGGEEFLKQQVPAIQANTDAVKETQEVQIPGLEQQLGDAIEQNSDALRDIATKDGDRHYPKLLANVATNDRFRKEWSNTVQGRVRVDNTMGRTLTFYLNGARWKLPAGVHYFHAPCGELTANVAGEKPTRFTIDDWRPVSGNDNSVEFMELRIKIGELPRPF